MKKILFISLIVLVTSGAPSVRAQTQVPAAAGEHEQTKEYTLLEPLPCIEGAGQNCKNTGGSLSYIEKVTINEYISYIFKLAIALAVFLATVEIIWGGFEYMLSAVPFVKVQGKERINRAIFGLAAALVSYLILQTIDPRLVQVNTTIPPICPPGTEEQAGSICNPKDAMSFKRQLDRDLDKVSTDNLQKVNQLEKNINDLKAKRAALVDRYMNNEGPEDPNYIDASNYELQLAEIDSEINSLTSSQTQILGVSTMYANFKQAIKSVTDGTATDADIKDFKDSMTASYNKYKADPTISNDPAARARLDFEYKFQNSQIDEQQKFVKVLKAYMTDNSAETKTLLTFLGGLGKVIDIYNDSKVKTAEDRMNVYVKLNQQELSFLTEDAKIGDMPELTKAIQAHPELLNDLRALRKDPELREQYVTLLRNRNDAIQVTIENKKAKK